MKMMNVLSRSENLNLDFVKDDLPSMPALEGDGEVKVESEETISEIIKLNPLKRKITATELKISTPNKSLKRLPISILLA